MTGNTRPRTEVWWFLRILIFFAALTSALTTITFLVNVYAVPPSAYELNGGAPQTILLATFVNGTWDHLGANLYAMGFLLMGVLVLPVVDWTIMGSRRYLLLVTWGQVSAGLLGALLYYVVLVVHGVGPDGAGSSIINGGLIGVVILAFMRSTLILARNKRYLGATLLAVILFAFIGELVQGFLQSGNAGAHYLGFVAGFSIAFSYLRVGRQTENRTIG
ncbi:MAG: hypothetical protein ACLP9K_05865 [Nitrososphaerales archaeon]